MTGDRLAPRWLPLPRSRRIRAGSAGGRDASTSMCPCHAPFLTSRESEVGKSASTYGPRSPLPPFPPIERSDPLSPLRRRGRGLPDEQRRLQHAHLLSLGSLNAA